MELSAGPSKRQESSADRTPVQGAGDCADLLRRLTDAGNLAISGLYVHIPFCFHKCHYCDFYSIVDDRQRQQAFTGRLIDEARTIGPIAQARPRTIFVGGGTPTLLEPSLWEGLLAALHEAFDLSDLVEFTVEANPETVTQELLSVLASGGVNRLSIGAQSFNPLHLKTLERWHDPANVERSVGLAHRAGITNVNLDLIFAIPGQSIEDWRRDLKQALSLGPSHLSCYSLMYEPNTPLTRKLQLGRLTAADEQLEARMFQCTIQTLGDAGFEHYEISNFALPGRRCEHNLIYWRNENWLALGPSASGHVQGVRWKNIPHLGRYLASRGPSPIEQVERLDPHRSTGEQVMLRLRLIDGAENDWLDPRLDATRSGILKDMIAQGLLERGPSHTRLTRRGLMVADSVFSELL